uniref:Probable purine permease n=1 Tax=Papaver somniferum TaxID=3469 RepID=A0A5B7LK73_PAPSO|nr:PUP3b [Papaver somniferum]
MKSMMENDQSNMKGGVLVSSNSHEHHHHQEEDNKKKKKMKLVILIVNCIFLSVAQITGPLLLRVYYLHGGQRKWLSSWLQTVAFPFLLIPISVSWFKSKSKSHDSRSISAIDVNPTTDRKLRFGGFSPKLFISCIFLGIIVGLDSFLYAYGVSYLPVSTSSLLMSTQLAFTAAFALLLVRQKFTPYSINSVVLLTLGAVVLAFHTNGDKPIGVSKDQYFLGFFVTLGAAALFGFMLPFIELVYRKACEAVTYDLVMRMQFIISMVATVFCTIAMLINKDFQAISREAKGFELGETKYYIVLIFTAVSMQCAVVGTLGVIHCASSLFSGVLMTLLLPIQQICAIFFFNEKFSAEKGMSLGLSIWGFASYFYGEYKQTEKKTNQHKAVPINSQEIPDEV